MLPFGCCISSLLMVVLGGAKPLSVGFEDMFWLWLMGGVMAPVAIPAFTIAAAMISASECSLIQLLEMMLGPVWTWLFLGEEPPWSSVLAGVGLTGVLTLHTFFVYSLKNRATDLQAVTSTSSNDELKEPL